MSSHICCRQNLLEFNKHKLVLAARHQDNLNTERFRSPKKRQEFTPGVESVKRHALTTTAPSAAAWWRPSLFASAVSVLAQKSGTGTVARWDLILQDYRKIRQLILANGAIMQQTNLQVVDVSYITLVQWYDKRVKGMKLLWCNKWWSFLTYFSHPIYVTTVLYQIQSQQIQLTIQHCVTVKMKMKTAIHWWDKTIRTAATTLCSTQKVSASGNFSNAIKGSCYPHYPTGTDVWEVLCPSTTCSCCNFCSGPCCGSQSSLHSP